MMLYKCMMLLEALNTWLPLANTLIVRPGLAAAPGNVKVTGRSGVQYIRI